MSDIQRAMRQYKTAIAAISHDILCPAHPNLTNIPCHCGLIQRVREQQRSHEEAAYWRGRRDAMAEHKCEGPS